MRKDFDMCCGTTCDREANKRYVAEHEELIQEAAELSKLGLFVSANHALQVAKTLVEEQK